MSKLPIASGKEIIKVLCKIGFIHIRTHGSHAILCKEIEGKKTTIPVPLHRELAKGTLRSIMKQADLNLEDLLKLL